MPTVALYGKNNGLSKGLVYTASKISIESKISVFEPHFSKYTMLKRNLIFIIFKWLFSYIYNENN